MYTSVASLPDGYCARSSNRDFTRFFGKRKAPLPPQDNTFLFFGHAPLLSKSQALSRVDQVGVVFNEATCLATRYEEEDSVNL